MSANAAGCSPTVMFSAANSPVRSSLLSFRVLISLCAAEGYHKDTTGTGAGGTQVEVQVQVLVRRP